MYGKYKKSAMLAIKGIKKALDLNKLDSNLSLKPPYLLQSYYSFSSIYEFIPG